MVRFAPEGVRVILIIVGITSVLGVGAVAAGHPGVVALLLVPVAIALWFFRDPERTPPADPRLLVSPADGRVVDVRTLAEHELLGGPVQRISIFMSPLDVHVNRAPAAGVIERIRHTRGRFHAAFADKSSDENERTAMVLSGDGRRYLVVQIAGAVARRIVCRRHEGDHLERGERYGMIMFGSRVDLYLPPDVVVRAATGMRVRAGTTPIGEVQS